MPSSQLGPPPSFGPAATLRSGHHPAPGRAGSRRRTNDRRPAVVNQSAEDRVGNADRARMIHAIRSKHPPHFINSQEKFHIRSNQHDSAANRTRLAASRTLERQGFWSPLRFFCRRRGQARRRPSDDRHLQRHRSRPVRYVTGAIEVIGAILILIPSPAGFGALLLACMMAGAVIIHLTVLPASPIPA
jgi:hypothetical protein